MPDDAPAPLTDEQALARIIDAKAWLKEAAAIGNPEAKAVLAQYQLVKANPGSSLLRAQLTELAERLPGANEPVLPPAPPPATKAWRVVVGREVAAVVTDAYSPSHQIVEAAPALAWAIGGPLQAVADWVSSLTVEDARLEPSDDALSELQLARYAPRPPLLRLRPPRVFVFRPWGRPQVPSRTVLGWYPRSLRRMWSFPPPGAPSLILRPQTPALRLVGVGALSPRQRQTARASWPT
jgi:hypothetical protein